MKNKDICLEQFKKFYSWLMKAAPEGYTPWFFKCETNSKNPIAGLSWKDKSALLTYKQCLQAIEEGYNLGISARKDDPLAIIDIDNPDYVNQAPANTLTCISRKRIGSHSYCWAKDKSIKINLASDDGEIRSEDQYLIAPGSYVPFNLSKEKDAKAYAELPEEVKQDPLFGYYTIKVEAVPREITFDDVPQFFKDYKKAKEKAQKQAEERCKLQIKEGYQKSDKANKKGKYSDLFNLQVSDIVGNLSESKRVGHPLHDSDTNANFSLSKDGSLGHCWRHLVSLNGWQFLCVSCGYASCGMAGTPHKGGMSSIRGDKNAYEAAYQEAVRLRLIPEYVAPVKEKKVVQPKGWARVIKISKIADKEGLKNCPECNRPLTFIDNYGFFKCEACPTIKGGLKAYLKLDILQRLKQKAVQYG